MDLDRPANVSFVDFVGGLQLLQGEDGRAAMPVLLTGICVSGALGNLLLLLIFTRDFRNGRGSEVKELLCALASTDLAILLLCAPVRAVTYYKQSWTLGAFACRTADWFQHSCVVAKTLIMAVSTRAKHTATAARAPAGSFYSPTWIHAALACVWMVSMLFPLPQLLFTTLLPLPRARATAAACVSEMPQCAADFMRLFYKIYPTAAFALPITVTLACHTRALYTAVNHAPRAHQQSKVTLVLLCVSGALGLLLLPEWAAFAWVRLGHARPPAGLVMCAQALVYAASALTPLILMTMYDDVRQGLLSLWLRATCRGRKGRGAAGAGSPKEGTLTGPEVVLEPAVAETNAVGNAVELQREKTFPDVEHFWTGRRNTHVDDEHDPVPWEREEKML